MEKPENHIFKYDFIRIIFMLMTLGVHIIAYTVKINRIDFNYYVTIALDSFFLICNPLFFMLSGKLNLSKKFEKKEDYINYYKKKFVTIFIPFFIISFIIYLFLYKNIHIGTFLKYFMANKIETNETFWFVYTLIGILLLSPFFSKMLQSMNYNEKKYFLIICTIINFLITFFNFFNITTTINLSAVGIVGWHFYYFAGYLIDDLFKAKEQRYKLYVLGIFAFILENLIKVTIKHYYRLTDPCLLLTLQAFALYIFIINIREIKNIKVKKIITYISKHTYVFYLLHMVILESITKHINIYNNMLYSLLLYIFIFIITMLLSIIIQKLIIKPIQWVLYNMLKLNSKNKTGDKIKITP